MKGAGYRGAMAKRHNGAEAQGEKWYNGTKAKSRNGRK